MKKKSYSALLLLLISFASLAQPRHDDLSQTHHQSRGYQRHFADTAESPDEFFRNAVREIKP
ncbi:hypothetical protein EFZ10_15715 [Tatumella sp. TA1]|uniref:hypothetical protein n=1 Tax=Rosenbergiella collisarenosi TaxID=1544695 RepID=UPI0008F89F05|nr:hypothetical protein [Rosenbergiella collisarenosi]QGX92937.1 hypothetical protein EFZ10_15715 [Tatumella sp. TA1]